LFRMVWSISDWKGRSPAQGGHYVLVVGRWSMVATSKDALQCVATDCSGGRIAIRPYKTRTTSIN